VPRFCLGFLGAGLMKNYKQFYVWLLIAFLILAFPDYIRAEYAQIGNETFYQPPTDLTEYNRGDLIRWEQESNMNDALKAYGTAYRVMYVSKGSSGAKIAVTGMIFIPLNTTDALNAIAWGHGTVGVADKCAPSKWPMLYPVYEWPNYGEIILTILENGYAAVAPDYEGLGTPGLHPWLHHESAGNTIIDGIRAYRNLATAVGGFTTTNRWGVWGHSQGAMAARAANVLANDTAPELTFVGSVEVAGFNNTNISKDFLEQTLTQNTLAAKIVAKVVGDYRLFPFWGYGAQAIRVLDSTFDTTAILGPLFSETIEIAPGVSVPLGNLAEGLCFDNWMGMFIGQHPESDQVRQSDYMSNTNIANWVNSIITFGGLGMNASGPAYLIFGGIDPLFPLAIRLRYIKALKRKGILKYKTKTYWLADHDSVIVKSKNTAMTWLKEQFAAAK